MTKSNIQKKINLLKIQLAAMRKDSISPKPFLRDYRFPKEAHLMGVKFSSVCAKIKPSKKLDLTLIELVEGSSFSGVFTKSETRSSPVRWCEKALQERKKNSSSGKIAILVNSGNANTFTGGHGATAVDETVEMVSRYLDCDKKNVFVASTGVIGEVLPVEKIIDNIPNLCRQLSADAIAQSAEAIMTTDTFPKGVFREFLIEGKKITIAGIAKGSGMIAPDMATMLGFIFTDISICEELLQDSLSKAVEATFNSISVDSDTSTSDSVFLAATGAVVDLHLSSSKDKGYQDFFHNLSEVMKDLSHLIVKDGEGATKFIEIEVTGASSYRSAKAVCKSIANSPLFKTAVNGEDPNWGRIVMAIGKSGEAVERDKIKIKFGQIVVAENGWVSPSYTEELGSNYMKNNDLKFSVDLAMGGHSATFWTCDFSNEYISINADYRS